MNYRKLSTPAFLSYAMCILCSYDQPEQEPKSTKKSRTKEPYDVIIVPGVPYEDPKFKFVLKARLLWAKYLYDQKITKNIIFSGGAVYSPYVEAEVMRIYADSMGIPPSHTFAETEAEHSTENIYYSVLMAKKAGYKKIAVATDHYQAVILNRYMKKHCPDVDMLVIDHKKIDLLSFLPEIDAESAYQENFVSIIEREDKAKRFQGTMGKNVKLEQQDSVIVQERPVLAGIQRIMEPVAPGAASFISSFYDGGKN